MRSGALQFLEMQALEGVEITFVWRSSDGLHCLSKALDDGAVQSGGELELSLQPVEIFIGEFRFHCALMVPI